MNILLTLLIMYIPLIALGYLHHKNAGAAYAVVMVAGILAWLIQ